MATKGVRKFCIGRIEAVLNNKRNHISVECNIGYQSPKITI